MEEDQEEIGAFKFASFEVLGELQDGRMVFWSRINRKTYITALKDLNLDKLVQIGGDEIIRHVSNTIQHGKIPFRNLKKDLIAEASKRQLGDPESLGQGIHLLKSGHILLICGGRAVLWDGSRFSAQEQPLVDGKFIEWEPGSNWIDIKMIISRVKNMNSVYAQGILDRATELFSQWRFTKKLDFRLITGWVFAQIVQTVWLWRPHLWMSGPQGSGKTLMSLMLELLGGDLALRHEGQVLTEPGLRQSIGSNSSLVVIDEFEKSQHRDQIIEFLRSAGRGGVVTKGSINQKAIRFRIRHMVFVCSIETGLSRAAENARFLVIETRKDADIYPQLPQTSQVQELRVDIFSYAIWAAFKARGLVGQIKSIKGVDPRFVEAVAVPFSMIAACDDDPLVTLRETVQSYILSFA